MNKDEENHIQFVKPGEDTPKAFQAAKQPLYLIAFIIQFFVVVPLCQPIRFRWTTGIISRSSTSCRVSSPS